MIFVFLSANDRFVSTSWYSFHFQTIRCSKSVKVSVNENFSTLLDLVFFLFLA